MRRRPDCKNLGLDTEQLAGLSGFTGRAVAALAHLREAWCGADPGNRAAVEASIRALLLSHSLREIPRTSAMVLCAGLDGDMADRLLDGVGLERGGEPYGLEH